jgi:ABC-type xylose transport system permease subunit
LFHQEIGMTVDSTDKTPAESKAPTVKHRRNRSENLVLVRKVWPWIFLVALLTTFSIASQQMNQVTFLSFRSVQGILLYASQILLIGLGETFIIIAAGIDLSAGWVLGFSSVIGAQIMQSLYASGASPVVTIVIGMLGGTLLPSSLVGSTACWSPRSKCRRLSRRWVWVFSSKASP